MPKPDPIVLNKTIEPTQPVTPQISVTPSTPIEPTSSVGMTRMQKLKEFTKKNKKLVIALSILGVALLIAVILIIFSYKPAGTINNQPIVSTPVVETEKPIVLSKECAAENQDIIANVPSDWTCSKNNSEASGVTDLLLTDSDIKITFPKDVQPAIGCGINAPNCGAEIIYTSSKIDALKLYKTSGKITVLTANIILGTKNYVVNIRIKDLTQTELTSRQKELIVKILEGVEINTEFSTDKKLSFEVEPIFGPVNGTQTMVANITVDKDTVLSQKDKKTAVITKGNGILTITSYHEWTGSEFQSANYIATTESMGQIFRVKLGVEGGSQIYYTKASNLTLGSRCEPVSSPKGYMDSPCGTYPLDGGWVFQCTPVNGTVDTAFCDSIMTKLNFTFRDN